MVHEGSEPGLVIVYTGDGKGKTTAALGLCLRAVGHGYNVRIIQFIKSDWPYGERRGLERLAPEVQLDSLGAGCIGIMGDDKPIEEHRAAAQAALKAAEVAISSGKHDIVILDEITIAIHLDLISANDVLALIANKPGPVNVVLTGRYAPAEIIDAADLVTEMKEIKHPFREGKLGREGIDF
ncbi:MAG: cob(I)yrinic acid a,c-diamide adenosyltransferase [candidate division Zixibacteria bacterium]|nr:cob(I)yrinic acid a,c-diamide adenosyltransferase [candidate division Zixibacteria bacterium]